MSSSEPSPEKVPPPVAARAASFSLSRTRGPLFLAYGGTALALVGLAYGLGLYTVTAPVAVLWPACFMVAGVLAAAAGGVWYHRRWQTESFRSFLFHHAFQALPESRVMVDPAGRVLFANSAYFRMTGGADAHPLTALSPYFSHNEESAREFERLKSAVEAGRHASVEISALAPDGRRTWYAIFTYPIALAPGYMMWRIENITDRYEMEQIIREEQEKLVDFLENAPVGFYSVDEEGRFLFASHTFAEWLGCHVDHLLGGLRLSDFLVGGLPDSSAPYDPFGGEGRLVSGNVTFRAVDGRIFPCFISQSVVRGEDGSVRTRSVVRDLSPEQEWAEALRLSEHRFRRFFEDAPVGIALLDLGGKITESNAVFRELLARDESEIVDMPLIDLIVPEDQAESRTYFATVAGGGDWHKPLEVRFVGDPSPVAALVLSRLEDADGAITGLLVHMLDLTEQKVLEEQFAQSQKMQAVGQLAGGVAHDFNNLLTAMIGFCDLLLMRHTPGDQSFADIMQVKQNANRAANLVRQLLAFSRQQTLQPRVLNVTDTLAELSNLLRRLIGENITLDMSHGRDLWPVKVDEGQLEQVIINLAVNARDAMNEGGKLAIRTENLTRSHDLRVGADIVPAGEYVRIVVTDTGHGIPEEDLERIFEPFFSTKEVGAGTGLGLAMVYGILKQTGGYISVESAIGQGTTFTILLPRHRAEGESDENAVPEVEIDAKGADLTGAGTILLVEDEDAVRLFSARALRNKGYKVLEAQSGTNALEVLNGLNEPVDMLITDIVMPQMDGPSLIQEVRAARPGLKVICISGYAEDSFRERLGRTSGVHFLAKPFSLNQLAGLVKEVMKETRAA